MKNLILISNDVLLWVSVAILMLGLALWFQRRSVAARRRADRARRAMEREDLGGDSYFMPPAPVDEAVELDNPVEIESLLSGESDTVAGQARDQLEATTDISITTSESNFSFALGTPSPPPPVRARGGAAAFVDTVIPQAQPESPRTAPAAAAPAPAASPVAAAAAPVARQPIVTPPPAPAAAAARPTAPRAAPAPSASPAAPARAPAADAAPTREDTRVPVRELVLAWFEARGYRASPLSGAQPPIELVLRHRADVDRVYAFVVEREKLDTARAAQLLEQVRAAGMRRLLIAAERGFDAEVPARLQRQGVRLFDEAGIRAEVGKIDIKVAAKIIAVARSRAQSRTPRPAVLAARNAPARSLAASA